MPINAEGQLLKGTHYNALIRGIQTAEENFLDYDVVCHLRSNQRKTAHLYGHTNIHHMGGHPRSLVICMLSVESVSDLVANPDDIQAINATLNKWMAENKNLPIYINTHSIVNNDANTPVDPEDVDIIRTLLGFVPTKRHKEPAAHIREQIVNLLQSPFSINPKTYRKLKQLGKDRLNKDMDISALVEWLMNNQKEPETARIIREAFRTLPENPGVWRINID